MFVALFCALFALSAAEEFSKTCVEGETAIALLLTTSNSENGWENNFYTVMNLPSNSAPFTVTSGTFLGTGVDQTHSICLDMGSTFALAVSADEFSNKDIGLQACGSNVRSVGENFVVMINKEGECSAVASLKMDAAAAQQLQAKSTLLDAKSNSMRDITRMLATTDMPTSMPSSMPSSEPSPTPTGAPTAAPTSTPTATPTTHKPSPEPTALPTFAPGVPTPAPTAMPTFGPTVKAAVGTTYLSFDSAFNMAGVTKSAFEADTASMTASRQATADSMAGVVLADVYITNVVAISGARRSLLAAAESIDITFTTTVAAQDFGYTEADATQLFDSLSAELSTAVSDGSYNTALATESAALGATALGSADANGAVTSEVDAIVTTTKKSSDDDELSGGAIAGIVIGSIVGFAILVAAAMYFMNPEMLGVEGGDSSISKDGTDSPFASPYNQSTPGRKTNDSQHDCL